MAKLQEEILVIKVSKLLKDTDHENVMITEDVVTALTSVVEELAGKNVLVEIVSE